MPLVTVSDKPSGAPKATTGWPTLRFPEEAKGITVSDFDSLTLITAKSAFGSRPVIVAGAVVPLLKRTLTDPPLAATEIT